MKLTKDAVISMQKAAQQVIEDMLLLQEDDPDNQVAPSILALATVQRDFLAGMLES